MRFIAPAALAAVALGCASLRHAASTPRELFNGHSLAGWHADVPAADTNAHIEPSFIVRNGYLVSMGGAAEITKLRAPVRGVPDLGAKARRPGQPDGQQRGAHLGLQRLPE